MRFANNFFTGFKSFFEAMPYVFKHRLQHYFLVSGLISLILGILIFGTIYLFSDDLAQFVLQLYPWQWKAELVYRILTGFSAFLIFTLGFISLKYVILIGVGPFMGPLSEKIDLIESDSHLHKSDHAMSYSIWRGINLNIRNLIKETLYVLLFLLLGLIPILSIFSVVAIFLTQAYYAGYGNMDFYTERYCNLSETKAVITRNKALVMGNGAAYLLVLLIPIVGLIVAPVLATVGATRVAVSNKILHK